MQAAQKLNIFLSYGHQAPHHVELAQRIKRDLEARGHTVWFDAHRLKSGRDWETDIEQAIRACDRFLLLMTPWSIRRSDPQRPQLDDGFCLNELAKAVSLDKPIVPVLIDNVEQGLPLSICRLQYTDLRAALPLAEGLKHYEDVGFPALAAHLEEDRQIEPDELESLRRQLAPLDFQLEIARHIAHFTGREWLLGRAGVIDRWLADEPALRVFWLVGDAGVGKSAVAVQLAHRRGDVAAFHFCVYDHADKNRLDRAVQSIAYQLAARFPDFRQELLKLDLNQELTKPPGTQFENLLAAPLKAAQQSMTAPGALLVVIDALDEATDAQGRNAFAQMICEKWKDMPAWLRLVVTSRRQPAVEQWLRGLRPFEFDADSADNRADLRNFFREMIARALGGEAPSEAVLDVLDAKSEGLFLYAMLVVQALEEGLLSIDRVEAFPKGLAGYYLSWFTREFPDPSRYEADAAPLVGVIAASREPLPRALLARALGLSDFQLAKALLKLGSLFPEAQGSFRLLHKSLGDWLTDTKEPHSYLVDAAAGNAALLSACRADAARAAAGGTASGAPAGVAGYESASDYTLRHLPAHLAAADCMDDLRGLMFSAKWLRAKLGRVGIQALLADFQHSPAFEGDREWRYLRRAFELSAHVLARNPEQLPGQMTGRLIGLEGDSLKALLAELRQPVDGLPLILPKWPGSHVPADSPMIRVFAGHSSSKPTVVFAPDGRTALSSTDDHTLRLWDIASGEMIRVFADNSRIVIVMAISPDGRTALAGSTDGLLRLWDLASGETLRLFAGHVSAVFAVAFAPDGRTALSSSDDNTVRLWDVENGATLRIFAGISSAVEVLAFAPDGQTAFFGSNDRLLRRLDLASGETLRVFEGYSSDVNVVAFAPDGRTALSGSDKGTVELWDLATGETLRTLAGHSSDVQVVAYAPDGRTAISGFYDGTMRLWDLASGESLRWFKGHCDAVVAVAFAPDGRTALSGAWDKTLRLWDIWGGDAPRDFAEHSLDVSAIAMAPDGTTTLSGAWDKTLRLWDLQKGTSLRLFAGHTKAVNTVAFAPDGRTALSGSADKSLRLWDILSGVTLRVFIGHHKEVHFVAFSPDGRTALSGSSDNTLRLWDIANGESLRVFEGHSRRINAVAFSPDGRTALSGARDRTLWLWDIVSGEVFSVFKGHSGEVDAVAFAPNGRTVLSGSHDKTLRLWDVASGETLCVLEGHSSWVHAVAFAPDGRTAISGSNDNTLRLWDVHSGKQLAMLETDYPIRAIASARNCHVAGNSGGYVFGFEIIEPEA